MKLFNTIIVLFFSCLIVTSNSYAIEGNLTITDKEVIERLSGLEEGQKNLEKRFDDLIDNVDNRFDDLNNSINNRFDDVNNSINNRFDDVNNRFDDVISLIHTLITVLSVVGAGVFATMLLMWRTLSVHKGKFESIDKQLEQIGFLKETFLKLQDSVNELIKHFKPPDKIL